MQNKTVPAYGKPIVWVVAATLLIGGGVYAALMLIDVSQPTISKTTPESNIQHQQPAETDKATTKDQQIGKQTDTPIPVVDSVEQAQPVNIEESTESLVQEEDSSATNKEDLLLDAQVKTFLADIKNASNRKNGYDLGDLPPDIATKLIESPEFASRLLNHYSTIGDGAEKTTLHNLFVDVGAMSGSPMIANLVADNLGNGDEASEAPSYRLLADLGVRTPESRDRLFNILPSLSQSNNVSAVIQAIAPEVSTPETRQSVVNELSPYLTHPDPEVRSAAIHTVTNWGSNQQAPVLERALADPSKDVRHAAAGAALTSNVQSDSIKSSLLSIMNSGDESMSTRVQAHYALTRYSLDDDEYGQFHQFHELLSTPSSDGATTDVPNG